MPKERSFHSIVKSLSDEPPAPDMKPQAKEQLLMKALTICLGCLLLMACTHSSGVLKMGPDTYSVSATSGQLSKVRKIVLTEANRHCTQMGKEILIINVDTSLTIGDATAEVTFRCLSAGDPELKRPDFRKTPDTVIEDHRDN